MTAAPDNFPDLWSSDRAAQNAAYQTIMVLADKPVDWAYTVWDETLAQLTHTDNHNRAIAAQLLCRLTLSDPEHRMLGDFERLLAVTRDERFVTARHCLQAMARIGMAGDRQQAMLLDGLERRFVECATEKNCTLIRYDIAVVLRQVYDATSDTIVRETALRLIGTETDEKYRKKYGMAWRGV